MDFGQNVSYREETELLSDPGEYPSAAEGARNTFSAVRDNRYIPEYSDDTQYVMVLTGLETYDGEECYVYRLEIEEPDGTLGAAYAYAYQSGNIYMEGDGGEFVFILGGDPDSFYNEDAGIVPGRAGNASAAAWEGDYTAGSSYVITIMNGSGEGFDFEAYQLTEPAELVASGHASLTPDDSFTAEYGKLSFSLSLDAWNLDLFAPREDELSMLNGSYTRNDYAELSGIYSDEGGEVLMAIRGYSPELGTIQFAIIPFAEGYGSEYGVAVIDPDNPGKAEGEGYTFELIEGDPMLESDDVVKVTGSDLADSFARDYSGYFDWEEWRDN